MNFTGRQIASFSFDYMVDNICKAGKLLQLEWDDSEKRWVCRWIYQGKEYVGYGRGRLPQMRDVAVREALRKACGITHHRWSFGMPFVVCMLCGEDFRHDNLHDHCETGHRFEKMDLKLHKEIE